MTINDRPKSTRQENGQARENASDGNKHAPGLEKKETGRPGGTVDMVTAQDLDRIWAWNGTVPSVVNRYVDEMIEETAKGDPAALAICAWDGEITYGELNDFATRLAARLVGEGVVDGQIVPLCFNKSKWTTVAILAVLKAGGAFVLLDSSLPEKRNRSIVEQIGTSIILAAPSSADLSAQLCTKVVQVDQDFIDSLPHVAPVRSRTRPDPSSSPMYAIFTSGSTGIPKCAVLSHSSGASAIMHQIGPIGFTRDSRVFDFSSYAFDASVHNVISSLLSGACLCVPSEKDRLDNVNKAMASMRATIVDVTPTVSRLLDPNMLPDLKTLILLGEAVRATDASRWEGKANFVNAYGPCECTPISTVNTNASNPEDATSIGKGVGAVTWVVDPENYNRLVPPGCIGELLLEGPLVGCGYLNNPEKTSQAFVDSPTWLRQGTRNWPGRQARLYRTGDLVQYRDDGSLRYIGRKDTQVKIRGRRIELEEIEIQIQQCLPNIATVVAEVIIPKGTNSQPMLVAFVLEKAGTVRTHASSELRLFEISQEAKDELASRLPSYMIPAAFLMLDHLPKTATAKTDRKTLREMGAQLTIQQLAAALTNSSEEKRQPTTNVEIHMQKIWCEILGLEPSMIGLDDSFLKLGGDSFAAMKVVAAAREAYLELTVADIMQYPELHQVASRAKPLNNAGLERVAPFSLLGAKSVARAVLERIVSEYQFNPNSIQDIYPCTPLQEGLMSLSMKRPGDYVLQAVLHLAPNVNVQCLRVAWEEVVRSMPLLRTTFLVDPTYDLLQVVLDESITWLEGNSLDEYLEEDRQRPMDPKKPFARYAFIKDTVGNSTHLVWTVHHALYDAWTLPLITNAVDQAYKGHVLKFTGEFQSFIKYTRDQDEAQVANYWKTALANCESVPFPTPEVSDKESGTHDIVEHRIPVPSLSETGVTISTILRAAWALVAGNITNCDDVVFGIIVAGRNAPVAGIDQMAAPTIATVPLRVNASKDQTISQYTSNIQRQGVDMIPFEQTGLQRISKLSSDCKRACMFETLLVIRPQEQEHETVLGTWHDDDRSERFNTYGLSIEVQLGAETMVIRAMYNSKVLEPWVARKLVARLESVMLQLSHPGTKRYVGDIQMLTNEDLKQIWDWNRTVPSTTNRYADEMIKEHAQANPDAPAVCAWDGELTYGELDRLAGRLASHLMEAGIGPDAIVPLCFEKSMWTPVATLAVAKAGGAFVLLDPSLPEQRLRTIVNQVKARTILSSASKVSLSSKLCSSVIQVSRDAIDRMGADVKVQHCAGPSSTSLYVVFTSGSTGVPKGAVLTHANFCSNVEHQAKLLGFSQSSRVFDFASYAFDIAVENIFITLATGGCICIPSDADRRDNVEGAMTSMRATLADLTPSVARLLNPSSLPDLQTLILGGEAVSAEDVLPWWGKVRVINGYGPAECTITSTINKSPSSPNEISNIGKGVGLVTWVVDPEDHNRLLPPGCTGELLLEGPLVGKGYLNEPEKTAAAFIEDPAWLLKGISGGSGRRGRLYKTGDLVKYTKDGTFAFLGRKDAQVKIHGQRVELADIEHHLLQSMPEITQVVVDKIEPRGEDSSPALVAFLQVDKHVAQSKGSDNSDSEGAEIIAIPADVMQKLAKALPLYMIPTAFFALSKLPLGATGKMDRKRLREIGSSFSKQELAEVQTAVSGPKRASETGMERQIQCIWARVLKLDPANIGIDDGFLQLGGDSIAAMRVVGEARQQGLDLTVADIFNCPTLSHLAKASSYVANKEVEHIDAFSLLSEDTDVSALIKEISTRFQINSSSIQDAYPCTPLQEGLLSLTLKSPGDYVMQATLELSPEISEQRFRDAWEQVAQTMPILRTRIIPSKKKGLLQVVLNERIHWVEAQGLQSYMEADARLEMNIGQPLCRYAMVKNNTGTGRFFVWTLHHALYDGWSMSLMMDAVTAVYHGRAITQGPQFQSFIKYTQAKSEDTISQFWGTYLGSCAAAPFPVVPLSIELPNANESMDYHLKMPQNRRLGITTSTLIRAAWALVVSRMTNSDDVVFGVTSFGRNVPITNIESMAAPAMATVPVRVRLPTNQSVGEYTNSIQREAAEMISFEQTGLSQIAKMSPDCEQACGFQTLLVIQPQPHETNGTEDKLGEWDLDSQGQWSNTYSLVVEILLGSDDIVINTSFDARVIQPWIVKKLLTSLETVMHRLDSADSHQLVADIDTMTTQELDQIWTWNAVVPKATNRCVHDIFSELAKAQPEAMAVNAWDGDVTYGELEQLTTRFSHELAELGVGSDVLVPLCFEKSMWTTVATLAVLKAGGAFVLLDSSLPEQRLRTMVEQIGATLIISSNANMKLSSSLSKRVVALGPELRKQSGPATSRPVSSSVSPTSAMFSVFTSGSTGVPKGIVMTHRNFASLLDHQSQRLEYRKDSRVFDFSSYAFDTAVQNIFVTLCVGGCLCVPSDRDRKERTSLVMKEMRATIVDLTPTVARLVEPTSVPDLKTIVLGGEASSINDISRWWGKVNVVNVYGPAECTINSTLNSSASNPEQATHIGKGIGLVTWVVDPENHNILVPPGCIGELLLEGPLVGRGYLNEPEKTAAAFIENPSWLLKGTGKTPGRQGRLYKTGDLVGYNEDGSLAFHGRKDSQLKIRGQRVELGEIECKVQDAMPNAIQVAIESIKPDSGKGTTILAAFVVESDNTIDEHAPPEVVPIPRDIEQNLLEHLPRYMIPTVMFTLAELPLTPSGKTNRRRLREIGPSLSVQKLCDMQSAESGQKRQPTSEIGHKLQAIWAQVLGVDPSMIGLDDTFFRLGGDSIAAMKLVGEAGSLGLELSVADIFRHPKLEDMSQIVVRDKHRTGSIPALGQSGLVRQSFAQERLWFLEQLHPGLTWYHMPNAMRLRGSLHLASLEIALLSLERRHETLRTTFTSENGVNMQFIHPFTPKGLNVVALLGADENQINQALHKEETALFNLETEPGWRVALFQIGEFDHILSIVMHHIISDGWSVDVLHRDLETFYAAALRGQDPLSVIEPLPIQYADYSVWQQQPNQLEEQQKQLDFWVKHLENSQPAELICDKPRPATLSGNAGMQTLKVEGPIYERLQHFCKSEGVTVSTALLAAFRATHFRLTGKSDATIGSAISNRDQSELKDIVGFFVNMQCVRIKIEEDSFKQLVEQAHQASIKCFSNQSVPFEKIVSKLQRDRDLSRHPLVQMAFAFHSQSQLGNLKLEGLDIEPVGDYLGTKFDLEFHAMQETNGLEIQVLFSTDLYESQTVINMLSTFEKVLENGLLHPDVKITSLPLLSDESFSDLDSEGLIEIHQTKYARNSSIIDVFKQHVYSSPDKVAVKDSSSQLTFAELDLQSNLIACWLRKRSLNDEALVGVLSPRSCQTIVAFLGILKAHLAYLPLDVKTPAGRMEAILSSLEDEKLVLMGNEVRPPSLSLLDIKFISISDILRDQRQEDFQADFLQRFSQPSATSLAYVMFTSGSTGKPKGVMIEHRGVVRLTTKNNLVQHLNQDDTWAHMANIAFDVSTTEIYAAILNGITVVCIDHMTVLDYAALEQTFIREKIRTALFTPALLKQCLLESPATVGELTTLKMGGDRVDPQDVSAARQLVKGPIMNCYGPTENTGCSTSYTLQDEAACVNGMPIGRAISNSGAYVVDAEMRLVPVGVVGELVVTGDGLARGYLEPKQNINRFVTLTIGNAKVRAYRTGDYVRYRPTDRQLDFFGRIDGQVKIRGHRVETEEIENLLRSDPLISDAIVILHSVNDNHRLAGFVIAKRADSSNGSGGNGSIGKKQETAPEGGASEEQKLQERLRSKLEANLPPYMVPQSLTVLDAMPLNINGKIDRQALIEKIQISNNVPKTIRQPTSNAQKQMQMIWARVLSSEAGNIGLDDNFFQLGGDSILAMRVVGEARKVGTKLAVADIFRYKSLEALAGSLKTLDNAQIEQSLAKTVLIDPATKSNLMAQIDLLGIDISSKDVLNILPVTSCQRNYIVRGIAQGQYCNYIHLNLGPTLDLARFQSACITTLQRFPILRARFLYLDGRYWQVIPRHAEISLEIQDVSGDLAKFSHNFCLRDTKEFLPTQPPLGITIFKHPTQGFQMTLRISHAQYDGVCFPTILQSLSDAYEGKPLVPVLDYSRFLLYASHRRSESINYWTKLLQGSSPTVFPSNLLSDGNPRPAKPQQAETRGMVDFPSLPENITSATLVSAAWAVLLSILTGKNDVVYGHIVNGRSSAFEGVEEIVGTCLNHIPVRVNLSSHKTSTQLLNSVQNQVLDIGDSDSLGYKDIVKHCTDWGNCEKFEFNTLLHHQTIDEHPEAGLSGAKSRIEWFLNPDLVSPATITVVTYPQGDRLLVEAYGNTDAITTKMVARIPEILGKIVWDLGTRLNAPLPSRVDGIDTHH